MPRLERYPVPRFRAAVRSSESARNGISQSTYERRAAGKLPPLFRWLLAHPDLLFALYLDACALTGAQPNAATPIDEAA